MLRPRNLLASLCLHGTVAAAGFAVVIGTGAADPSKRIVLALEESMPDLELPEEAPERIREPAGKAEPRVEAPPAPPEQPFEPFRAPSPVASPSPIEAPAEPLPIPHTAWLVRLRRAPVAAPAVATPLATPPRAAEPTPMLGQNPPPPYPKSAVRRKLSGSVEIEATVDAYGKVLECRVTSSSGHRVLDEAALRAVRTWRFRDGPGVALVPVHFQLTGH